MRLSRRLRERLATAARGIDVVAMNPPGLLCALCRREGGPGSILRPQAGGHRPAVCYSIHPVCGEWVRPAHGVRAAAALAILLDLVDALLRFGQGRIHADLLV